MEKTFKRGAKPSPRHKLLSAVPFRPVIAAPPQFAVVPKQLSYWDNDQDGDCVTAEEAFAKAAYSVMQGQPELFVPDAEVIAWASRYGVLNGATLTEVMDHMLVDGLDVAGVDYKNGPYAGVDYANEAVLQAAIAIGPVKIAIDANALPSGAGNGNGWFSTHNGNFGNTDHCVALCGYGSASYLFSQLGIPLPAQLPGATAGYLLFTWSSIGFVTHGWLMGTCTEAWLRNPTTTGTNPIPPPPPGPEPGNNHLHLTTALQPGYYAIGDQAPIDPVKLQSIINELLALLGEGPGPSPAVQLRSLDRAGALPLGKILKIVMLIMAALSAPGGLTPASIQALIVQILAIIQSP